MPPVDQTILELTNLLEQVHGNTEHKEEDTIQKDDETDISLRYDVLRYKNGGIRSYHCYVTHNKLNETKKKL